jgi:hypothetical protein
MRSFIPRWRKMTWVIWTVNALFLLWIIVGVSDRASKDCPPGDELCINASDAGTGIGVALIIMLWFFVFVVLAFVWLMTRPKHRTCPVCGNDVKEGSYEVQRLRTRLRRRRALRAGFRFHFSSVGGNESASC